MTAVRRPIDARRRALYGKIEIAKKALRLDDDAYRDVLHLRYGKSSRTDLSTAQLVDLVEHFRSLGFKPAKKAPKRAGRLDAVVQRQEEYLLQQAGRR